METKIDTITAMLHAYIDGRLDDKAHTKIKSYFIKQPTRAEEFKEFRTLNKQLIHAFGISMDIAVPEKFNELIDKHENTEIIDTNETKDSNKTDDTDHQNDSAKNSVPLIRYIFPATRLITNIAATCVLVFAGFLVERYDVINTGIFPTPELSKIEQLAIDAHTTYAAEKDLAVAVTTADLEKLMEWAVLRLEEDAEPAELDEFDFSLMGGRILPSLNKPGLFYMYDNSSDSRLTYYIRRLSTSDSNQSLSCNKMPQSLTVCRWSSDTLIYFLIGTEELNFMKELSMKANT